jgi:hypothetical protein
VIVVTLATIYRDSSRFVQAMAVAGFAYASLLVLVRARRHWPAASRPLVPRAPRRAPASGSPFIAPIESAITLSRSSWLEYDHHLRPTLYRLAAERLKARGISIEEEPEAAERLLGKKVWELVRPVGGFGERGQAGAAETAGRLLVAPGAAGVPPEVIQEVVTRIEEV